jgi:hypothetical protein
MQRREILQAIALMMGNAVLSPVAAKVIEGYAPVLKGKSIFKTSEVALISEIAEMIIPETKTPGAKAAKVGEFIELMLNDCYKTEDQESFKKGLAEVNNQAQGLYKKTFIDLNNQQKTDVLQRIEAQAFGERGKVKGLSFWFTIKELTVTGYFTSEIGAKQALEYVYVPARYDGCMDMKPDQKTWAM